jgi:superfamily II DNA or RNA helicase
MHAPKILRDYQTDAVGSILRCWKDNRSCLAVMATGGGKTLVAASAAGQLIEQGRVLFLANRNELCLQPRETFTHQLGFVPALEKADSRASLDAPVVIGSVQTLCRTSRLERFSPDHFSYVFADEAHLSLGKTWQRIFRHFEGAKLCGITATPFRSDAKDLREIYEAEAYRKSLFELVDAGWLVNPDNVYRLDSAISLAQVRVKKTTEGMDYDVKEAADAILPYFKAIATEIAEKHASRHILAFLPLIESSKKFVAAAREAGINAVHIDGEDPEREAKLRAFAEGKIALLSNSNLLHTGVDFPICDATLCLRPTRSKVLYQQVVGRSTRPLPGVVDGLPSALERQQAIAVSPKKNALIIDPLWLTADMDLVTPAYLIAQNQEEAVQIQELANRNGKSYNLKELKAQVVFNREEAIRRRLENVANFRAGRMDYRYFAAQCEEHGLLLYEPVYAKECAPPSNFVKGRLLQAGIDPEGVPSSGLANQILLAIGRRRYRQRAEIRELAIIAETEGISPELWKIHKNDSRLLTQ